MKVVTYQSADAPEGCEAIARIRCSMVGKKGKVVEGWHPVIFHAATPEEAELKALGWWLDEQEKERKREEHYRQLGERRSAKVTGPQA